MYAKTSTAVPSPSLDGIRTLVDCPLKSHMNSHTSATIPRKGGPYVFRARRCR